MGMMDVPEMRRLHRVARVDFWIAIAAILGVLGLIGLLFYLQSRPTARRAAMNRRET